ncbi:MAG: WXG100 family type VII secretion target [Oscillospiraceae bacterium]|nr:WXG100 family type VII secretion target [Oscillospiraceae bacterium]MBQ9982145.1 WXG100 family type VII secretion target [Oscillospiraceae bacterium]
MNNIRSAHIEDLYASSKMIAELAENYRSSYTRMYNSVDNLGNSWQGYDANTFFERIGNVKPRYEQMYFIMMQYSEFIRSVAIRYEAQSEEIAKAAAGLEFE